MASTDYPAPECYCDCPPCYTDAGYVPGGPPGGPSGGPSGPGGGPAGGYVNPFSGNAILDNGAHSSFASPYGSGVSNELSYGAAAAAAYVFPGVGEFGSGWLAHDLAKLKINANDVLYPLGPNQIEAYDKVGGVYQAGYYVRSKLVASGGNYALTAPDGSSKEFDSGGKLTAIVDAGGNRFEAHYDGSGKLASIGQTESAGSSSSSPSGTAEYLYAWDGSGFLTSITYKAGGGFVRKTEYSYNPGKLKSVVVKQHNPLGATTESTWEEIDMTYYTYADTGLLKHVILPEGCKQMAGAGITIGSATEAQYNAYAAVKFSEYDGSQRITKVETTGGLYKYEIAYHDSGNTPVGFDVWHRRTTITQKTSGGTILRAGIYYFNFAGQMMLFRVTDGQSSPSQVWNVLYQQFANTTGRRTLSADASGIASVSEGSTGLVTLQSTTGRIRLWDYDANGNLNYEAVKKGSSGTLNKLVEYTYSSRSAGGPTIYNVATKKIYPVAESTATYALTQYSLSYFSGTLQVQSVTTTLPAVSAADNGDGIAATTELHFNEWGFVTEEVDERDIHTKYEYDNLLGVRTQMKRAYGDALETTTDYTPDLLGRVVLEEGPVHSIDINGTATSIRGAKWTYYRDVADEVVTFGGYIKTSDSSEHAVGPIHIHRLYEEPDESGKSGWRMESFIDAAYSGSTIPAENASYARSTWVRWKADLFDEAGEQKLSRLYWNIPGGTGTGTKDTDYGETAFAYDNMGRQEDVTMPGGTIQKSVFNLMDWRVEEKTGTSAGNLVTVALWEYSASGEQTKATKKIYSGSDRVVDMRYDYRHRVEEVETTVEKDSETGGNWTLITKNTYDNRSNVVAVESFHTSTASANQTSYQQYGFDARNRQFRSVTRAVSSAGVLGNSLIDNLYFDAASNVVRQAPAGSESFTVMDLDALSRTVKVYIGYDPDGGSSSSSSSGIPDPSDISGAVILEQRETDYDAASNAIKRTLRHRFHDATGVGELRDPTHEPKARVYYSATYPDALGRTQADVDAGTNAGTAWTRPSAVPLRSDTLLINSNTYDSAGNIVQQQDPEGICTCRTYDKADRLTELGENCVCQGSSSSSGGGPGERNTRYEYTSDSLLKKLKCENLSTGEQVTEWVYDVTTAQGSAINSHLLVSQKIYPDTGENSSSSSSSGACNVNWVDYLYNGAGEVTAMTDQACTRHDYALDKLGRLIADQATLPFGTDLDDSVNRLEYAFDERLLRTRVSSIKKVISPPSTTKVNEVKLVYNDFNQPVTEYQEHSGAVNISTSRKVQYAYGSGTANSVVSNSIRRHSMTTPSANVLTYIYSAESADKLSRPDTLWLGSSGVTTTYKYLGLANFVGVDYSDPGVGLSYANGPDSEGGDQYKGLDRFGRIVELAWVDPTPSPVYKVQAQYGYGRASNVRWRRDKQAHADSHDTEDQLFSYDGLYQVTERRRGNLTGTYPNYTGISSQQQTEAFGYDETGNWLSYDTAGDTTFNQDRAHNKCNEITSITNPANAVWPLYDPAGNMVRMPKSGFWDVSVDVAWDAWNRPVAIGDGTYAYDGLFRRTKKTFSSTTTHFYYTDQWQVCESYVGSDSDPKERLFWGLRDINDLIRRQRYSSGTTIENDLYALRDMMNIVAVCEASGAVERRFSYDAFGTARFLTANWGVSNNTTLQWTVLFQGHWLDTEYWLYQMRFRYYHPALGRWLSRDPIGEKGGANLTSFNLNNPLLFMDQLGLWAGRVCVAPECKNCKELLEQYRYLDENEMPKRLRALPEPGNCVDADGFYYGDGTAVKIYDFAQITILCYCIKGKWVVKIYETGIVTTWEKGKKRPSRWPGGPPPYEGDPPGEEPPSQFDRGGEFNREPGDPLPQLPPLNPRPIR